MCANMSYVVLVHVSVKKVYFLINWLLVAYTGRSRISPSLVNIINLHGIEKPIITIIVL